MTRYINSVDESWKTKAMILGGAIGALIGVGTVYLMARTAEERGGRPPQISTTDAVKAAVGVIGLMRGIASLGED
jgi:hypothetical protein